MSSYLRRIRDQIDDCKEQLRLKRIVLRDGTLSAEATAATESQIETLRAKKSALRSKLLYFTLMNKDFVTKSDTWCSATVFFLIAFVLGLVAFFINLGGVSAINARLDTIGNRLAVLEGMPNLASPILTTSVEETRKGVLPLGIIIMMIGLALLIIVCRDEYYKRCKSRLVNGSNTVPSKMQCSAYGFILEKLLPNVRVTVTPRVPSATVSTGESVVSEKSTDSNAPSSDKTKSCVDFVTTVASGFFQLPASAQSKVLTMLFDCGASIVSKMPKADTIVDLLIKYGASDELRPLLHSLFANKIVQSAQPESQQASAHQEDSVDVDPIVDTSVNSDHEPAPATVDTPKSNNEKPQPSNVKIDEVPQQRHFTMARPSPGDGGCIFYMQ